MMRSMHIEQKVASAGPTDFRFPDWSAPIDLHERLPLTPAEHTVKGLFMQQIVERARAATGTSPVETSFLPFDNYPMRAWMELLVRCAELAYPAEPVREGIRRLGQLSYATFAASSAGQVMTGLVGADMGGLLRFVPRYYRVTGRGGIADVSFPAERHAIVHVRDVWDFPDAYHVGAFEGAMSALGAKGHVKVRKIGVSAADLEIVWR